MLESITWKTKWKRVIKKSNEWATWRWANVKIDKKKSCIIQINYKHFQGRYEGLQLGNVSTCNDIFKEHEKLKKLISKTFFHKLTKQFVNEGLGSLWEFAINEFMKP